MGHSVRFPSSWGSPFAMPKQKRGEPQADSVRCDDTYNDFDDGPDGTTEPNENRSLANALNSVMETQKEQNFSLNASDRTEMEIEPMSLETTILRTLSDNRRTPVVPGEFNLDSVLSQLPYHLILERGVSNCVESTSENSQVPIVSRVYEESYLREPFHGERACASGALCECNFIDKSMPFTGVEFVPYGVKLDSNPSFCVLCSRKITQKLFYEVMLSGKSVRGIIQRYGNIVNVPGEYARECALICPAQGAFQCLPVPIMSHQRNKYEVYTNNGVRVIRQLRVGYEDFHMPSTEEAS